MKHPSTSHQLVRSPALGRSVLGRDAVRQGVALCLLLAMMAWAVMGPSGLVAWGENYQRLAQRRAQLAQITAERDELKNRVNLLDPARADPDLTGELLRSNLNVIHPDEMVLQIKH